MASEFCKEKNRGINIHQMYGIYQIYYQHANTTLIIKVTQRKVMYTNLQVSAFSHQQTVFFSFVFPWPQYHLSFLHLPSASPVLVTYREKLTI